MAYIYALIDPRKTNEDLIKSTFYIGQTIRKLKFRLKGHISEAKQDVEKNIIKEKKIRKILKLGLKPIIICLHETDKDKLNYYERYYIKFFKLLGCSLTNRTDGGEFNPLVDRTEEEIKKSIEKGKTTREKQFKEKTEREAKELGIKVEEVQKHKQKEYINNWQKNNSNKCVNYASKRRDKLRKEMGEEEYKKLVADKRRNWYSNLPKDKKLEQRKKDVEYRKKRKTEGYIAQSKNQAPANKISFHKACQLFKDKGRDDIELIESGYNGWIELCKFWDKVHEDWFWNIPHRVYTYNLRHHDRKKTPIRKVVKETGEVIRKWYDIQKKPKPTYGHIIRKFNETEVSIKDLEQAIINYRKRCLV